MSLGFGEFVSTELQLPAVLAVSIERLVESAHVLIPMGEARRVGEPGANPSSRYPGPAFTDVVLFDLKLGICHRPNQGICTDEYILPVAKPTSDLQFQHPAFG